MCLLKGIPTWLQYIYRIAGILQFSSTVPKNAIAKILSRLWCFPLYFLYYYIFVAWIITEHKTMEFGKIRRGIDMTITSVTFCSVTLSVVMFHRRSNQLQLLLTKVGGIKYILQISPKKQSNHHDLFGSILLVLIVLNFVFACFLQNMEATFLFFCYISPSIGALDHLFLSNILRFVRCQFETINQHLQRQVRAVDLSEIFPLTKAEKIKNMKEHEISFNICKIQELSHLHYDLVNLATDINKLFEITTIVSIAMWFGYVIDTIHYIIHVMIHTGENKILSLSCLGSYLLVFFLWLFIMVRSYSLTQKTANTTSIYVHDIWNKYSQQNEVDRRVLHLQLISFRPLNTKLRFTAMNLFSLDWTFCH
ncbi:7tm 7 domain containing protein, partial [Asbolus verrucosus]